MGEMNNNMTLFIQTKDGQLHKLENCSVSLQNKPNGLSVIWDKIKAVMGLKTANKPYQFTSTSKSWSVTLDNPIEFR